MTFNKKPIAEKDNNKKFPKENISADKKANNIDKENKKSANNKEQNIGKKQTINNKNNKKNVTVKNKEEKPIPKFIKGGKSIKKKVAGI